jgi:hypothetical protein
MNNDKFYTKRGLLTRYAFRCGYIETKDSLSLDKRHGTYHVVGTVQGKRVWGSFDTVVEARKFMSHPMTHKPSRGGSVGYES